MRTLKTKPNILFLFVAIAALASGCGKSKNDAPPPPGAGGIYNQGNYPGGPVGGGSLGSACTSIQGPIPFQGALYIDSANVIGGAGAPVAGTGPTNPYGQGQLTMTGAGSDGWISIQAQMISATTANSAGQLQLSALVQQQIMYQMQYSGMAYGQMPCASIVAINLGHYNTTLYGGKIQIMLNNQIPYIVYF